MYSLGFPTASVNTNSNVIDNTPIVNTDSSVNTNASDVEIDHSAKTDSSVTTNSNEVDNDPIINISLTGNNNNNNSTGGTLRRKSFGGTSADHQIKAKAKTRRLSEVIARDTSANDSKSSQNSLSNKLFHPFAKSDDSKSPPRKKSPRSDLLTSFISSSDSEESKERSTSRKESTSRRSSPRIDSPPSSPHGYTEKTGNNVKFALRSYVVSSDPEKNFESSNQEIDRDLIAERLKNQETLLNYFIYLKKVIANSKLCLQLDAYNGLGCHYSKKETSESEKQTIQTILYTTLLDALSLKNTMFFSSAGSPVLLENFDELITIAYPKRDCNVELLRSQVFKEIERRSKKDQHQIQTAPSLEKENISLFPHETALLQIKKIKNSEDESLHERFQLLDSIEVKKNEILELNRLVTDYIKRTDEKTSLLQKISFMNFYKSRAENYLLFLEFLKAWVSNPNIDERSIKNATLRKDQLKIKLEEPYKHNPYLKRLNEEIEYLSLGINFEYDKGHKCVPEDVDVFLADLPHAKSDKIHDFIDKISTDMKIHSAQTFNLMTFDTCMLSTSSKYPNESTIYSNSLVNFIFKTFNSVQTRHRAAHDKKPHSFTENYFHLYMFFVNLGVELLKKHDYLSSMAIYMALESSAIEWVLKNKKDIPHSFQNNLGFFRATFNPQDNYGNLRKIMEDCRADKIFHTPSTSIFTTFIHDFEKLSLVHSNSSQVKSLEIKYINDYFKEIRFNFETASKNHTPLSNIFSQIYSCNHPIEAIKPDAELIHSSAKKSS